MVRVLAPCAAMGYVFSINILRTLNESMTTHEKWNVEGTMFQGWMLQSFLSMVFSVYWQWNGSIGLIRRQVITIHPAFNSINTLRRDIAASLLLTFLNTGFFVAYLVSLLVLSPFSGWRRYPFGSFPFWHWIGRNITAMYGTLVWNLSFCYFVLVVRCISRELKHFNQRFKLLLDETEKSPENAQQLPDQLLKSLSEHNKLAEKIMQVDNVFQVYTFAMIVVMTPQTIFALLLLIRRETWLGFCYSIIDISICLVHLIGLTIMPAEIYTEFRVVHSHLYLSLAVWSEYNLKVYQIVRMFTESVSHSDIGISLGGFILITKSLILTCISLIIPYVLLCVQMQFGSDMTLRFSIFNVSTEDLTRM